MRTIGSSRVAADGASTSPPCGTQCEGIGDFRVRMLARQGDVDGAYAALAANPANYQFPNLFFFPEMKAFRRDPRFMPLVHRLGLVDYWTRSGHWPDFCAEPDLPYDCGATAKARTHHRYRSIRGSTRTAARSKSRGRTNTAPVRARRTQQPRRPHGSRSHPRDCRQPKPARTTRRS